MRVWAALGVAALAVAAPAGVRAQQTNDYQAGVEARRAGHPEEAARLLKAWLAAHPADLDAQVQLAYADLALGHLDTAESGFRAVLAAAPDYKDASDGLALVAERRKAPEAASRSTLTIEGARSDLAHGPEDWYEAGAHVSLPVGARDTVDAGATYYRRFGHDDVEVGATVTHRSGENLWLRAAGSVTPSADFRPRWSAGGGFDWRFHGGPSASVMTFDARYEDFPAQHVTTLAPGLVQYFAGGRAWVTAKGFGVIPQGGRMQLGWMMRADVEPKDRHRLFVGVADGPDTDLGVVTEVTSAFAGFEVPLGPHFGLTGALAHEWREAGADRTEFRLGLKFGL